MDMVCTFTGPLDADHTPQIRDVVFLIASDEARGYTSQEW